jgi:hypothetical protein
VKLPTNMKHKGTRFKVIAQEAIDWYIEHGRKDVRSFRIRMNIILKTFNDRVADDIKPSEIGLRSPRIATRIVLRTLLHEPRRVAGNFSISKRDQRTYPFSNR